MEHRDVLAFAEPFQDAVDAVRLAVGRCINDGGFTQQQVHELMLIATRLSVWCTERSNGAEQPDGTTLTPRQHEIAALAALGCTNAEIAKELGISINTVKLRLKQTFERLFVANRTELANVLRTGAAAPSTAHHCAFGL